MSEAQKNKLTIKGENNYWYGKPRYGEDNPFYGKTHSDETKRKIGKYQSKPIRCIETGEEFESAKKAGESMGISRSAINAQLKGRNKTAKGYHFEYLEKEVAQSWLRKTIKLIQISLRLSVRATADHRQILERQVVSLYSLQRLKRF